MVDKKNDDRARDRYNEAVQIELRYAHRATKEVEQPASHNSADNSQQDIENHSLTTMVDQVASDETR